MGFHLVVVIAALLASPAASKAQAPDPPANEPPAADAPPAKAPDPPVKPQNPAANPNVRMPVLKPANLNPNPNAIMRNQAGGRGFGGMNMVQDRAIIESMSHERLLTVEPPAAVLNLLPALDDPSFAVREAASQKLLDRSFPDEAIWAVLDRFKLSEEARGRLLTVAYRRVSERPRGALGIRMGTAAIGRPGVIIQATLPGMPAEKFLKAGDVIEEIDGQPVPTTNALVDAIQNFAPGREIKIKLRRPERDPQGRFLLGPDQKNIERPIDLSMPLGNAEDLDRADPGDPRAGQNMQLQQRKLEAAIILRRFAAPSAPANGLRPVDLP
ncbi:MAG: PDZ domain-containing protein [Planctomycetes bacterium]|nr:PDZ domain-containing protein [Planctomycetota bacterium]